MATDPNSKRPPAGGGCLSSEQTTIIQHVQNATQFPALNQFYKKILKFSNSDLEQQQSLWKTNNMNFPDWFAPYHQEHPSACLRLNHTQGRGCPKGSSCSFAHMCILCGEKNHGAFQRHENGDFKCKFQCSFLKELTDLGFSERELLDAIAADKSKLSDGGRAKLIDVPAAAASAVQSTSPGTGTPSSKKGSETPSASKSRAPAVVKTRNSFKMLASSEDSDSDASQHDDTTAADDSASDNEASDREPIPASAPAHLTNTGAPPSVEWKSSGGSRHVDSAPAAAAGGAAAASPILQDLKSNKYRTLTEFYKKILKFSNSDLEQQQSLWKTNNMNFPDWFAPYHQEHPSACLRLNHTQGRGCPKGSSCSFAHMCILCGEKNHGAFQRQEGSDLFRCRFQRMFLKELTDSGYTEKELLETIAAEKARCVPIREASKVDSASAAPSTVGAQVPSLTSSSSAAVSKSTVAAPERAAVQSSISLKAGSTPLAAAVQTPAPDAPTTSISKPVVNPSSWKSSTAAKPSDSKDSFPTSAPVVIAEPTPAAQLPVETISSRIVQDLKSNKYRTLTEFYKKILKFSNSDLEQQQSLWKTNNMNFPDWFAPYHQEHPSACLRLNHTQGRGCPKGSSCSFAHMCILCGEKNHGAFQRQEGSDLFRCRFQRMFLKELTDSGYTEKELLEAIAAEKVRPIDTVRPTPAPAAAAATSAPASSPPSRDADVAVPPVSQNQATASAKSAAPRPTEALAPAVPSHAAPASGTNTQPVHGAAAAAMRSLAETTSTNLDGGRVPASLPPLSHIATFPPIVGPGGPPSGYDLDVGLSNLHVGNSVIGGGMNSFPQGPQYDTLYAGQAGTSKVKASEGYRDDLRRPDDLQHPQQHFGRRPFQGDAQDSLSAGLDPFALQFDSFNFTPPAQAPLQGFVSSSVSALPSFSNVDSNGFSSSNGRPSFTSQSQFSMDQGMGYPQSRPSPAMYQQHEHMPPLQKQQQLSHILPLHQQHPSMLDLQQQHHHQQHQLPHQHQHQHQHVSMIPLQQQQNQHLMPPLQQHQQQRPSLLPLQTSMQQHHSIGSSSSPTDKAHRWLAQFFTIDRFFHRGPQYHLFSVLGEPLRPLNYSQAMQAQNFCAEALRPLALPFAEDAVMLARTLPLEQSAQMSEESADLVSRLLAGAISNNIQRGGGLFEPDLSEFRGAVGQLCSYLQKRWGLGHHHHHLQQQQQQHQHRQLQQQQQQQQHQQQQQQHLPLFHPMHQPHQQRLQQLPLQSQANHHSHHHQHSAPHAGLWSSGQERGGHTGGGGALQDSEIEANMFEETMSHLPWIQDIYSADDDALAADRIWGGGAVGPSFK